MICVTSCEINNGGGLAVPEDYSPVSLLIKEEGKVISLGLNYSDIEAVLGSPTGESETHGSLLLQQYGDVMQDDLIRIGFIDDKASLFVLTQFSGKKFYTDSGMTIGTSNTDFWTLYNVPDEMSYNDKIDARDFYMFQIFKDDEEYRISLVGENKANIDTSAGYYMYVMIDYKNLSCDVNKIVIGTPEALELYD
jgi:hypothetical protein